LRSGKKNTRSLGKRPRARVKRGRFRLLDPWRVASMRARRIGRARGSGPALCAAARAAIGARKNQKKRQTDPPLLLPWSPNRPTLPSCVQGRIAPRPPHAAERGDVPDPSAGRRVRGGKGRSGGEEECDGLTPLDHQPQSEVFSLSPLATRKGPRGRTRSCASRGSARRGRARPPLRRAGGPPWPWGRRARDDFFGFREERGGERQGGERGGGGWGWKGTHNHDGNDSSPWRSLLKNGAGYC
jgi:hypothetical protein